MTGLQILSAIGGIIGIVGPIVMFLIGRIHKTDEKLQQSQLEAIKQTIKSTKESIEKDIDHIHTELAKLSLTDENQSAKIEDHSKELYRLLDKLRSYQSSLQGFYATRTDVNDRFSRLEQDIRDLKR